MTRNTDKVISVGDSSIDSPGGYLIRRVPGAYGTQYFVEWNEPPPEEGFKHTIYELDLPDDVVKDYDWVDWLDVAQARGYPEDARRPACQTLRRMRLAGRSRDPVERFHVLLDVAYHKGWDELDGRPARLDTEELQSHWAPYAKAVEATDQARRRRKGKP